MNSLLVDAIINKTIIKFQYQGGLRIVEPHCYGVSTADNECLRGYQIGGYSSSGTMGWKMYAVDQMTKLTKTDQTFVNPRQGYKKGDRGMTKIFKQL